ncbi:MAG: Fe-S oxidoreductase, partial [Eubacterium sp.]|nr:Fe-S oxidoreductase [Eubacterium sp.]
FFSICNEFGLKVNMTTNGTLLEKHRQLLIQAPALRKVSISLHSYEANRTKISLDQYLNETCDFVKEAADKGIICELRLWNAESEGVQASNSLNINILKRVEKEFDLNIDLSKELLLRQNIKLADKVFLHLAQKFQWPDIERADIDAGVFCYGLRDQFGVLVDGTVVPCCLDSDGNIPLGNLFEQPLKDILNSARAISMYEGFTARTAVEDLCKKCGYAVRHKRS